LDSYTRYSFCIFILIGTQVGKNLIYNLSSPNPVSNNEFTQTLGMVLNRPTILGTPAWVMEGIFGEGSKIVTEGQFVQPYNLIQEGFSFKFPDLGLALQNLIR
jgi:NAD dependent epimerase/dehydratase family enzyme